MTDFIIIGNTNAVTYKEIFPLFKDNKVRFGCNTIKTFCTRNGTKEFGNVGWFSTLPVKKKTLTLTAAYDPDKYPKYENYDAINIDRIKDIPYDYDGVMGVPITILNYDLQDIEIVGFGGDELDKKVFEEYLKQGHNTHYGKSLLIYKKDNKWFMPFYRIMIRRTDILNNKNE